ncbi:extracellular catalytic domain type 1 short-chain-length polyhydroxyalkanoate depolymerase [Aromatoleum diolicum]|uniref:PHB depolymerase family esterase n=1 Tax=Aromatoleum diolicum TaxID=75796 RepID=A0ABX1Q7S7_9RHOO|nr:PHB depolymerase family esterase [Aromatoleum diolicum]NMG73471.1 PHB depolymerase family esterase [Aromatoleum diolicum]
MNARLNSDLLEATRLTRAGQLFEATALIQRALRGAAAPDVAADTGAASRTAEPPIEGHCRVIDTGPFVAGTEPPDAPPDHLHGPGAPTGEHTFAPPPPRFGAALREKLFKFRSPAPAFEPIVPERVPDAVPDGARFITGSYTNPAGTRSYKLYVPSAYRGQALPLIVMLHGCTQNPDDFAAGTRMNEQAEKQPCLVLYPAQSAHANGSKCWNWFKPSDQRADAGEPSLIAGMTREVAASFNVDPRRIYVAGLSAGGAMATTMAMTYADIYAAAGIHSGLPHATAHDLPSALAAMQGNAAPARRGTTRADTGRPAVRAIPIIVFHGDRDATVHPRNGEQVIVQFASSEARACERPETDANPRVNVERGQVPNGRAYTRTTYHHASGSPHVEQWTIHGAGHAWSGGSTRGTYTDPRGPDATAEMLRFFFAHSLDEISARNTASPE